MKTCDLKRHVCLWVRRLPIRPISYNFRIIRLFNGALNAVCIPNVFRARGSFCRARTAFLRERSAVEIHHQSVLNLSNIDSNLWERSIKIVRFVTNLGPHPSCRWQVARVSREAFKFHANRSKLFKTVAID